MKHPFSNRIHATLVAAAVLLAVENASATQIEPLGTALGSVLGKSVFQYKDAKMPAPAAGDTDSQDKLMVFYSKGADGKANKYAFVQNWTWQKQCKHGWVVGVDAATGKVTDARFVETQCPHADPIRKPSFHAQFKGKGPADAPKLVDSVDIVANATGSAKLAAKAVKQSIELAGQYKGKF